MKYNKINRVNNFIETSNIKISLIKGLFLGTISILIMSIFPVILLNNALISTTQINFISVIILFCSCLIGAFKAAIINEKHGMLIGFIIGVIYLLLIVLLSFLFQTVSFEIIDFSLFFVKFFGLLLFGVVGGILGINLKN